jgi:AcrR family transcriptional regulator
MATEHAASGRIAADFHRRSTAAVRAEPDPDDDLTARARIRNAALRLFAQHGVERTSIRAIAREAAVSSGLIQHHFGTKGALRAACDEYVLSWLVGVKEGLVLDGQLQNPDALAAAQPEILLSYRYLARSMIDGSPAAAHMFEQMVAATVAWLQTHHPGRIVDEHGYAAVTVAMETGLLAMQGQLSAALGFDVLSPEGHLRLTRAKVEFYSKPLLDDDLAAQASGSLDALLARSTPTRRARRDKDAVRDRGGAP